MRWWRGWMRRIRWDENPAKSYRKQVVIPSIAIEIAPICRCGRSMQRRAGYLMGGASDWVTYECPADRPWTHWFHSPWTTLRQEGEIRFKETK